MAFVDEEKKDQPQLTQNQQAPVSTVSAPGAGPAAGGKAQSAQANPAQPFTNLSAYLNANAPQVTEQANKIAGGLTDQYGKVTGDINKASQDFGAQVQSGYAQPNQAVVDEAASTPSAFVTKPENVKAFQSLYNDVYSGPTGFETTDAYGNVNKEANSAAEKAALVNTTSGLQTYFQNENPNATKGGNVLDSVLLRGSPDAYSTIQNAAKPYQGLADMLSSTVTNANSAIPIAQKNASDISAATRNRFTGDKGVIPTFGNSINDEVSKARADAQTRSDAVKSGLNAPSPDMVSDQALSDIGITRDQLNKLFGERDALSGSNPIDLVRYLTQQSPEVMLQPENVATGSDYQNAAALAQLTGEDISNILNQTNLSKAGSANLDLSDFDQQALLDVDSAYKALPPLPSNPPVLPPIDPVTPGAHPGSGGTVTTGTTQPVLPPPPAIVPGTKPGQGGTVTTGLTQAPGSLTSGGKMVLNPATGKYEQVF